MLGRPVRRREQRPALRVLRPPLLVQAVEGDTSNLSEQWSVHHTSTTFTVHESREWLFGTVRFRLNTDLAP